MRGCASSFAPCTLPSSRHVLSTRTGCSSRALLLLVALTPLLQLPIIPELFLQLNDYAFLRSAFSQLRTSAGGFTQGDLEAYKFAISQPGTLSAALNFYRNIFTPSALSTEGVLRVPTLQIWVSPGRGPHS